MASSTTRPVARVMPNSVSELMEKPKILMKAKVPIERDGDGDGGNDGGAPVEQEEEDDDDDDDDGFGQGDQDFMDGVADDGGGVEGDGVFRVRAGSSWRVLTSIALALRVDLEGVGVGKLLDADADGGVAGELEVGAIVFRADDGAAHVLQEARDRWPCS